MPSWIVWVIIGGIAGFLAGNFMGAKRPYGIPGDVILGIAGAFIGGLIMNLMNLGASGVIGSFVVAFIGALILIWGLRLIKKG